MKKAMTLNMVMRLYIAVFLSGLFFAVETANVYVGFDGKRFSLSEKPIAKPASWATFENAVNKTGWAYLEVYSSDEYSDTVQAYAAGLAEGYITKDLISLHWRNTYQGYCQAPLSHFCKTLQTFLQENLDWVKTQLPKDEAYWHQVGLTLDHLSGLTDGYHDNPTHPSHEIDVTGLLLLQLSGDLEDLSEVLKADKSSLPRTGSGHIPVTGSGHCSALIKVLPGNSDVYVAQDTWDGYNSMLRILKKYDFSWHLTADTDSELIPGKVMTFSSYPGLLASGDDFYIMSSALVSQETTIGNSNAARSKYVQSSLSVMEGTRAMVANRLARTGADWINLFSLYNSGTYNNQWMIVDYNVFKAGQPLADGLLYVLEQIPGLIEAEDRTDFLRANSYWPSFNIASFPRIFNESGQWDFVKQYGDWFTWQYSPRAKIFRRDHSNVKDLSTMTKLMRYNNFKKDPLSHCNCTPPYSGENAISARCDLNSASGTYPFSALGHRNHGGTDMKLTSSQLVKSLQFVAISGPTCDDLPPFQWSTSAYRDTVPHEGHPDLWTFEPVTHIWGNGQDV